MTPGRESLAALFSAGDVQHPTDSLGFLLWHVTHAWQRHLDEQLEPCGLTHLQFVLLISTAWQTSLGERPNQAALARWTRIHPMQVSQVVAALQAKALLTKTAMPGDRRAHCVTLTAEGLQRLSVALPIMRRSHHGFFDAAGGTEAALKPLLARLFEGIAVR